MSKLKNGLDIWIGYEMQMKKMVWFAMFGFLVLKIIKIEVGENSENMLNQQFFGN